MPRYRNNAIYQSAERLLASTPRKKSLWQRLARPVLTLGLAAGALATGWFLMGLSHTAAPTIDSSPPDVPAKRVTSAPAAPSPGRSPGEPVAASAAPAIASAPLPVSNPSIPPSAPSAPAPVAASETSSSPLLAVAMQPDGLRLRGELRNAQGAPLEVELLLHVFPLDRNVQRVEGAVVLIENAQRGPAIPLSGVYLNDAISLGQVTANDEEERNGYTFTFSFPRAGEPDEIVGEWTQRGTTGPSRLTFRVASPAVK